MEVKQFIYNITKKILTLRDYKSTKILSKERKRLIKIHKKIKTSVKIEIE